MLELHYRLNVMLPHQTPRRCYSAENEQVRRQILISYFKQQFILSEVLVVGSTPLSEKSITR